MLHRIIAVACIGWAASAQSQTVFKEGPYTAAVWDTPVGDQINIPPKGPYWGGPLTFNAEDLTYSREGRVFTNASNFGLATIPANREQYANRALPFGPSCNQTESLSAMQMRGIEILHARAEPSLGGAVWHYDYQMDANDVVVSAPYPSSFSQAVNIHGLLFAYCKTGDKRHLELAEKAGNALITQMSVGGVLNGDWFEEAPGVTGFTPYILNGHLYSVSVLYELADATKAARFRQAADQGAKAFDQWWPHFDSGYWTRYDMRPRSAMITAAVLPVDGATVQKITLTSGDSKYTVCADSCTAKIGGGPNGAYWVSANLPSLWRYWRGDEVSIKVEHTGGSVKIYSGAARQDRKEFFLTAHASEAIIRTPDLGWSTLDIGYQQWHAFLVEQIWKRTGNPEQFVTAARWQNYLRWFHDDKSTEYFQDRIFDVKKDKNADESIASCLTGINPLDVGYKPDGFPACAGDNLAYFQERLGIPKSMR